MACFSDADVRTTNASKLQQLFLETFEESLCGGNERLRDGPGSSAEDAGRLFTVVVCSESGY